MRSTGFSAALSAAALALAVQSGCASEDGAPAGQRAPMSVERQLPIDLYLANLCPGTETQPAQVRRIRRQAEVLLREVRDHPDWLVEFTYYDAHGDDERRLISIRQLAREHLRSIDDHPGPCEPDLRRRLQRAVD